MAETSHSTTTTSSMVDPRTGYSPTTKTFHSLRPTIPLPPETTPLSLTDYVFSLLRSAPTFSPSSPVFIDAITGVSLSYSDLLARVDSLTFSLSQSPSLSSPPISGRHVALILSPSSFYIPVLYFSLLSLGVVVSPANPVSTQSELTHLVELARPSVIFSVSELAPKLESFGVPLIFLDSPEFDSMLTRPVPNPNPSRRVTVSQSDSAVILYSSGTTGRVKGVELTHRNFIAVVAGFVFVKAEREAKSPPMALVLLPLFHVFGFFMVLRAVSLAETMVVMARFDFEKMLEAVEKYRITYIPVSPPLVVAMTKSELTDKYDLSTLEVLACGGAPLGKEVAQRFRARFPNVEIAQTFIGIV